MGFVCMLRVRYAETDQMGIVYHANYLTWFELARTEYLRSLGLSYREVEAMGVMLPVVEVNCRYLSPAYYDDELQVRLTLTSLGAASINFQYAVVRPADGELLAQGTSRQAFVGKDMRPINGKRLFPTFWGLLHNQITAE